MMQPNEILDSYCKANGILFMLSHDPFMLSAVEQISTRLNINSNLLIADLTPLCVAATDSYDGRILKFSKYRCPVISLTTHFNNLGIQYVKIEKEIEEELAIPFSESLESGISNSIDSALITYFRHHNPSELGKKFVKATNSLRTETTKISRVATKLLTSADDFAYVIIPNGRFPSQKAIELVAKSLQKDVLYYERGEPPSGIYFQNYPPQERIKSQESAAKFTQNISDRELLNFAQDWLGKRRQPLSEINEFAALWEEFPPSSTSFTRRKTAGFFTSSQDEFLHLGPEWQRHSWRSQVEAFEVAIEILEEKNFDIFIRVHPNLATKSHKYFRDEVRDFQQLSDRHPNVRIIWHDESVNTYDLLDHLDFCFVWDSTVGLEASGLGIPTISFATTRYGIIADVREALGREELVAALVDWNVDPRGAQRYMMYLKLRDLENHADPQQWINWEYGAEPLIVQLSKITVSGGAISAFMAALSVVDTYRNRSFRANLKILSRRLSSVFTHK